MVRPRAWPRLGLDRWALVAIFLAGAVWQWRAEWRIAGTSGFPLDDPWIHLQFARNLVSGHGFAFNPGEPSAGSTAPLWTLVLAAALRVGMAPVAAAKLLGLAFGAVAVVLAAAVTERLTRSRLAALVAGAACALSPRITAGSVSGMEIPL